MNDQKGNEAILVFALAILATILIACSFALYRDVKFYSANNWNFQEESGVRVSWGSGTTGPGSISAKQRFYFAYPFAFLVCATGAVVLLLELIKVF